MGIHFLEGNDPQAEIGFTIAPEFQGQGIGSEAVLGILGFLFDTLGKRRVMASVDPRNLASMALLKRVGMRKEAHSRGSLWFKGEWVDDVVWAIVRDRLDQAERGDS